MAKGSGQKIGSLYMELGLSDEQFTKDFEALKKRYGKDMKMNLGINAAGFVSGTNTARTSQRQLNDQMMLTNKTILSQRMLGIQLSNQLGTMFSIYAVERFVRKLAEVTGQFELQHESLKAILRDTEAADKIFGQIKALSVESPFRFKDLISYTKQLAAFSVPTNELYETMKNLSDVSAGLGVDMGRITLAFGQVKAASVLRGQELRQFTEAGIPLVAELADRFSELEGKTVSTGQVFERISKRMVSFEMVKDVFDDMTSAGGKFYKMQEVQAATLAGKISNLRDAMDLALADIGGSMGGILKGGVDALTGLTRNWEELVKVLVSVIAIYGTYTAASALWTAAMFKQASVMKSITMTAAMQRVVLGELKKAWWAVQAAMNAAKLANPFVAITTVVVALAAAIWVLNDSTTAQQRAQEQLNEENKKAIEQKEALRGEVDKLIAIINSETSAVWEQVRAYERLQKIAPSLTAGKTLGEFKAMGSAGQQSAVSAFESQSEIEAKTEAYRRAVAELKAARDTQSEMLKTKTTGGKYDKIDIAMLEQKVRLAKAQYDEIIKYQNEANFLLLPEKTRIDILKQRQKLLLAEKEKLTATKNLVMQTTDGFGGWTSALDPFEYQLNIINGKLNETAVMLKDVPTPAEPLTAKGKIEAEIQRLEGLLEALSPEAAIRSGLKDKIRAQQELLKAYDIPSLAKEQKSADELAAEGLKARIDLIRRAYSAYQDLIDAGYEASVASAMVVKSGSPYANVSSITKGKSVEQAVTDVMNEPAYSANTEALKNVKRQENEVIFQANIERLANEKKTYQEILDANKDFVQKMNEIDKTLTTALATKGVNKDEAQYIHDEAVRQLEDEYAKRSSTYEDTMSRIADMSLKQLEDELNFYLSVIKHTEKGSEDYGVANAAVRALQDEIAKLKVEGNKGDKFKDFKKTVTAINNVQSAVDNLIGSFDDMDASVKAALTAISATASGTVKILEGISAATAKGISAAEKASVILTVISYAIQIVTSVIKAFNEAEDERKQKVIDATKEYANMLDIMRDMNSEMDEMAAKNIFGDFSFKEISNGLKEAAAAASDFKKMSDKWNANNPMTFGGRSYYATVVQAFDLEAAKIELASSKISEARKAYLEGLISAYDDYKSAMSKISDYLSGIFGNVGSSIMDSITENMDSVKDSVDDMTSYVSDALWQMVEDIAYSRYFSSIFDTIQKEILGVMDGGSDDAEQATTILASYMDELGKATTDANEYMNRLKTYLESAGFDVTAFQKTGSNNSLRANIENIKEDTATKLAGYIAGIAQDSTMGRYNMAMIASALTDDGIMIKSEGLMQEVRENIGQMRANSDVMARVMARFDSCIVSGNNGVGVRVV